MDMLTAERQKLRDERDSWAALAQKNAEAADKAAAEIAGIAERLDGCFEPTAPVKPIISELVPVVLSAIVQLRRLADTLK